MTSPLRSWRLQALRFLTGGLSLAALLCVVSRSGAAPTFAGEPSAPPASEAVRPLLDRANKLKEDRKEPEALTAIEETLQAAKKAGDASGEARAYSLRALVYLDQHETESALEAYRACADGWLRAGYCPGRIGSLGQTAFHSPEGSPAVHEAIAAAVESLLSEKVRPVTSSDAAMQVGIEFLRAGRTAPVQPLLEAAVTVCERSAPGSLELAGVLNTLAQFVVSSRGPEVAEALIRRALAIAEKLDPESLHQALLLHNLAVSLMLERKPAAVVPVCEHSLVLYQRLAKVGAAVLGSWGLLTEAYLAQGEWDQAEDLGVRTEAALAHDDPNAPERCVILEKLADMAQRRRRFPDSARYYLHAADQRRKIAPNSDELPNELLMAAQMFQDAGLTAEADRALQDAVAVSGKASADPLLQARASRTQGFIAAQRGDHRKSLAYFQQSLAECEEGAPNSLEVADAHWHIAHQFRDLGDFADEWREYTLALGILTAKSPGAIRTAEVSEQLGQIAIDRGDYPIAQRLLTQALSIAESSGGQNPLTANTLIDLGNLASHQDDHAGALPSYERARSILEHCDPGEVGVVLGDIGGARLHLGHAAEADAAMAEAIAVIEKNEPDSADLAFAMNNRAYCLNALGKKEEAAALHRRAQDLWKRTDPNSPVRGHALLYEAERERVAGDLRAAVATAEDGWTVLRTLATGLEDDEARQDVTADAQGPAGSVFADLLLDDHQPERALEVLEQSRAQALWQALLTGRGRPSGITDADWEEYSKARDAREEADAKLAQAWDARTRSIAALDSARKKGAPAQLLLHLDGNASEALRAVESVTATVQDGRVEEDREWQKLRARAGSDIPAIDVASDRRQLDRIAATGTTFFSYGAASGSTLLFVLSAGPRAGAPAVLSTFRIPLTAAALTERVRELTRALREQRSEAVALSQKLTGVLFPGSALAAARNAKRLVIVPDGVLWELPFAALAFPSNLVAAHSVTVSTTGRQPAGRSHPAVPAARGAQFLGLMKPLCTAPSLALFVRGETAAPFRSSGGAPQVLAVGDPAFGGSEVLIASSNLPELRGVDPVLPVPTRLPGTRADAEGVARLYGTRPLLGRDATEKEVRRRLPDADVVHLATHGWAHPYWSGGSRVYLAAPAPGSPPDPSNDGMLEAWEIAGQLKLRADLVVLAACETDLGHVVPWEGVNGLTRSLLRAGARSVVASHWEVRDDSTRALMLAFHREVRAGVSKDEALRRAMVEVAKTPAWDHPYFWAAFALTGDRENRLFPRQTAASRH